MKVEDLLGENTAELDGGNIPCNLLTVAATGNSSFLEDLLKAGMDPDVGDSKGRTALVSRDETHSTPFLSIFSLRSNLLIDGHSRMQHIAAANGYEDCVQVLLRHACNVNIKDAQGNTALWQAIAARHHKVFSVLYSVARATCPHAGGDLLCLAARRGDVDTLAELLKHGLDVDAAGHDGATALRVALSSSSQGGRRAADVARFLVMNGASVDKARVHEDDGATRPTTVLPLEELRELEKRREVVHPITIYDSPAADVVARVVGGGSNPSGDGRQGRFSSTRSSDSGHWPRVSVYRGHPFVRNHGSEAGKLINLPSTMAELKAVIGIKPFSFVTTGGILR